MKTSIWGWRLLVTDFLNLTSSPKPSGSFNISYQKHPSEAPGVQFQISTILVCILQAIVCKWNLARLCSCMQLACDGCVAESAYWREWRKGPNRVLSEALNLSRIVNKRVMWMNAWHLFSCCLFWQTCIHKIYYFSSYLIFYWILTVKQYMSTSRHRHHIYILCILYTYTYNIC